MVAVAADAVTAAAAGLVAAVAATAVRGTNLPLTFAHPALVLPLNRFTPRFVNVSALAAGSLAPDFP
ncbi:MAG: DUF4184 family protein [Acidobacteria bacterium]|nr:DUF4184 family protein [Acidobacteriota bacterium]